MQKNIARLLNVAVKLFTYLLSLPVAIAWAVTGLVVWLQLCYFTCKWRFLMYLYRVQPGEDFLRLPLLLGLIGLELIIIGVLLWIAQPLLLAVVVLALYNRTISVLAHLGFLSTSIILANIQKGFKSTATGMAQFIFNHPKLITATIVAVTLGCIFPSIALSLVSKISIVAFICLKASFVMYAYDPAAPILQVPMLYARKLAAFQTLERVMKTAAQYLYYGVQGVFIGAQQQNATVPFATYITRIKNDDVGYFLYNRHVNGGRISLRAQGINDAQILDFMRALVEKPHIAEHIASIDLSGNNIVSLIIHKTLRNLIKIDASDNKLRRVLLGPLLFNLREVNFNNNALQVLIVPSPILDTLTSVKVLRNKFTRVAEYYLQWITIRARGRLTVECEYKFFQDVITEPMLQQHVTDVVPYALQPCQDLNTISDTIKRDVFRVTLWMKIQSKRSQQNYALELCNKIINYMYVYPIKPQDARAYVDYGLDNIIFSISRSPYQTRHRLAAFDNFVEKSRTEGSANLASLECEINRRFNKTITHLVGRSYNAINAIS